MFNLTSLVYCESMELLLLDYRLIHLMTRPLDVSIYSYFKAHLVQEFLRMSITKKTMDALDVSALMSAA